MNFFEIYNLIKQEVNDHCDSLGLPHIEIVHNTDEINFRVDKPEPQKVIKVILKRSEEEYSPEIHIRTSDNKCVKIDTHGTIYQTSASGIETVYVINKLKDIVSYCIKREVQNNYEKYKLDGALYRDIVEVVNEIGLDEAIKIHNKIWGI